MKQEGMTDNEPHRRLVAYTRQSERAIKDVAEALSVSEAMIVKVSKLLGFSGFRNLRSALWTTFRNLSRSSAELF
jgi:DNA-binding MurR/RpiR family transcriptional regulator